MMVQFAGCCDYYRERFRLYCGGTPEEQEERLERESTSTSPCIWEQKDSPAICSGLTSTLENSSRVVWHMDCHHSSGSCSAPPPSTRYNP